MTEFFSEDEIVALTDFPKGRHFELAPEYGTRAWIVEGRKRTLIVLDEGNGWYSILTQIAHDSVFERPTDMESLLAKLKEVRPPAPLALLKAALQELVEIDAMHLEDDEQCPDIFDDLILYGLIHLFFEGTLCLSYDPTTGRLGWLPTSEAIAEINKLKNEEDDMADAW